MAQNKVKLGTTRWVALMIQLGKFVGGGSGGVVADTNYLYPARWGWINIKIVYSLHKIYQRCCF